VDCLVYVAEGGVEDGGWCGCLRGLVEGLGTGMGLLDMGGSFESLHLCSA
jgi:hypothetical protein